MAKRERPGVQKKSQYLYIVVCRGLFHIIYESEFINSLKRLIKHG